MTRRLLVSAFLGVAALAAVFVPAPGSASAADVAAVGWWWRASQGPLAAPAPPTVPDGGVMVAGAPDGPTAIAAMRLANAGAAPVVTLKVAPGSEVNGSNGVVVACPSAAPWKPASAGSWDARPSPDCGAGSAPGVRSADGATYTFDLSSLTHDGAVDVVFTAGKPVDPIPASPTFQVAWERPDASAIAQSSQVSDTGTPPDTSFSGPDTSGAGAPASDVGAGAPGVAGGASSDFSLPSSNVPVAGGAPAPSDEQVAAAPAGGPRLSPTARPARRASASHRPVRPLAIVVLLLALGAACALALQPAPPPRQLSRFAAGPRIGTPPPLV